MSGRDSGKNKNNQIPGIITGDFSCPLKYCHKCPVNMFCFL
nr:MAG TPA: hypothetical protein [Caudoviricetes sp.]